MKIGRKIFYDKIAGLVIIDTGQWNHAIGDKTVDEEILTYPELFQRNRDTFDVLELPFGAYAQDFAESSGYRVNPETKALEFSYPDPNEPDAPQEFEPPLTQQIADIRADMDAAIMELTMAISMGGMA